MRLPFIDNDLLLEVPFEVGLNVFVHLNMCSD